MHINFRSQWNDGDSNRSPHTQPSHQWPQRESASSLHFQSRTSLTVQTAEGDRVTISLAAQGAIETASSSNPHGSTQVTNTSSSSRAQINVQGNLSEAELGDLTKLVNALGEAANESQQAGGVDTAALLHTVSGLGTVARFQFSQQQTVDVGAIFRLAA